MASALDPETRKALTERLRFYRELGIHDFYRRGSAPVSEAASDSAADLAEPAIDFSPATDLPTPAADKLTVLQQIREDIGDCTRCRLHAGRKNIVFGVGNPNAEIMFVGEGPGADEDIQGEPFVGRAGQLLNNMISAMGLKREDVYIANVVKCRPPGNRTPERDECETCSPFLLRQIQTIRPKMIVALGAVAAKTLLAMNDTMANLRGHVYDCLGTKLVVTYHPAYLLRDPRQKAEAWKDLQMVMKYLGMPIPKKS
jgi:DNA polymerase